MRDQYAGDVSDFLKFAFLRALARTDRTLGIAWYYALGHDGRADGQHIEWRDELAWQRLDGPLYDGLTRLPERSIAALENAAIWPNGTSFYRDPMPSHFLRDEWGERKRKALDEANVIFLDPDNGLGAKTTPKHATVSELQLLRRPGRAVAFITFPGRSMPHDELVRRLHDRLITEAGAQDVVTLRTNVSVPRFKGARSYVQRQRWFTVVDTNEGLRDRVCVFAKALACVPRVRVRLD